MPVEVAAEPREHGLVRPRCRGRVEARPSVVEERVVRAREDADLVRQAVAFERSLRGVARGVHPGVELAVDGEDGGAGAAEVGVRGRWTVERSGGGDPRFSRGEKLPRQAAAEAESDDGDLPSFLATLELVDTRAQVCDQSLHRGLRERGDGLGVPTECCGPAFFRQQVDREGREPVGGEARRDRTDVVGQAAVLVDHEHRTLGPLRRRPRALELAVRSAEANDRRQTSGPTR